MIRFPYAFLKSSYFLLLCWQSILLRGRQVCAIFELHPRPQVIPSVAELRKSEPYYSVKSIWPLSDISSLLSPEFLQSQVNNFIISLWDLSMHDSILLFAWLVGIHDEFYDLYLTVYYPYIGMHTSHTRLPFHFSPDTFTSHLTSLVHT